MSEKNNSETPGFDVHFPFTLGMHLGEHSDPEESSSIEFELGEEPCIIIRPCEEDGIDLVLDVMLSRTAPVMAVAMLTAARSLLIEEMRQAHNVDRLLADIFAAEGGPSQDAAEKPGEL